jgi:predicted RNA-binding Zn-ribbon protein involved in translation (DUF1610 family)
MRLLTSPAPSPTATVSRCPQCGAAANIRLIEPDLHPRKAWHVFECEECGLPRAYLIDHDDPRDMHSDQGDIPLAPN